MIIEISTALFQQKGYKGVGLNEILKTCNITKGSLYHHFPKGKEELLITCLQAITEKITSIIKEVFRKHQTAQEAIKAMIEKLVTDFEIEGTITGHTITSMVSEMGSLSESVREVCSDFYRKIQDIFSEKIEADGFSKGNADSIALMINASIEGGILLCLTQKISQPLKIISQELPKIFDSGSINEVDY